MWEVGNRRELIALSEEQSFFISPIVSADGRWLVVRRGPNDFKSLNELQVWGLGDRKLLRTFRGHAAAITSMTLSPDGGRLASVDFEGNLKV